MGRRGGPPITTDYLRRFANHSRFEPPQLAGTHRADADGNPLVQGDGDRPRRRLVPGLSDP
jgi:hypothetical protein